MSHQRFVILAFVLGSAFLASVLEAGVSSVFLQMAWEDTRHLGLVSTSTLVALLAGFGCFFALIRNSAALRFTDEVIGELWKVTWPTRDEALQATTTVIFTAVFVAAIVGVYDLVWKKMADFFLFTQG
jgi:preprotein translocase SecE subunit